MSTVQNIMIKASSESRYATSKSHKNIDFYDIWNGFRNYRDKDTDAFINSSGINFEDYIGRISLTGNELFCYPELAKKMREIKEYPKLKRSYKVNTEIKGMAFIEYFCKHARESFINFEKNLIDASCVVDNLIDLYGNQRHIPIIDSFKIAPIGRKKILTIYGINWEVNNNRYEEAKITEHLDLYGLLSISSVEFTRIEVEDITTGTPFLAIRIAKSWTHKGRVYWYNLDTCKVVSKIEMAEWV